MGGVGMRYGGPEGTHEENLVFAARSAATLKTVHLGAQRREKNPDIFTRNCEFLYGFSILGSSKK